MSEKIINVPDLGGDGEVIEISVKVGDRIEADTPLMTVESDKASMEVPAPEAGVVKEILLKLGDQASEGMPMLKLEVAGEAAAEAPAEEAAPVVAAPEPAAAPAEAPATTESREQIITVPDLGGAGEVIELNIAVGDVLAADDPVMTVESDKASMEVPSPVAGTVLEVLLKLGDQASEGVPMLKLAVAGAAPASSAATAAPAPAQAAPAPAAPATPEQPQVDAELDEKNRKLHAGPAVRKIAREFGVDLTLLSGSGPRGRIIKEDIQAYVKKRLAEPVGASVAAVTGGSGIPPIPAIDFAQFGPIEVQELSRLRKLAAQNFQRSWLNVPHVTQFDEADITELEAFRKGMKKQAEARGSKLTPLPLIIKAVAYALKQLPQFCASLSPEADKLILKQYVNIGVAVDTPEGLLVPVIKDADKKGLWEISDECIELANKAKNKQLKPAEMQGGCFSISSLGSIGGTAFTPIVNAPEVAILGISKAEMKPKWNGEGFEPRLMLPLSLSYDHRAINGAEAARFTQLLGQLLGDLRQLLM